MCGIAGYYSPNKKVSSDELVTMTTCIQHRGPDAAGYFVSDDATAGLGHRRLSIIDLSSAANQPMLSHNGRYSMVFNGEVYNFQEVEKKLGIMPRTSSDTEIILEAFVQLGVECVHLFNGMFAIAIYDKQEETMYWFRDRLGVKPFYYYEKEGTFAFSSEIKSLMNVEEVKQNVKVHKPSIHTFLYSGYIPEPYTIYDNIKRLPAGSYAVIKNGKIAITPYWQPEQKVESKVVSDFNSAKQQLKELLTSSVKYRMISDVPFGTFLSGGIDSSVVTAIAQSVSDKPVKTFSIGFKEAKFNESQYAKQVSDHLGTQHHEFTVTEQDALGLIDKMLTAYDEPYADSSAIPTMLVSKLARQHVTMTLSGDGGDELFLGYGSYTWAQRLNNPLVDALRAPLAAGMSLFGNRYKRAAGVVNYKSKARIKSHIFSQEQYFFSEAELSDLLTSNYKQTILFNEDFGKLNRTLSAQEEQALYDIKHYLKDDLLVKVDIASMQYALEVRTPFLDYRVVEFALNLDERLKKNAEGTAKYLLKEVLYDYVPKQIFDRPKWGFSIPLVKWLRTDLHYLIDNYLNEEVISKYGVVNYAVVKQLIQRFEKGEGYLYNRLWVLILLHKWMQEHGA
jgi:asparagine synthase (glutamine-hydrolysing)